MSEQPEFKNLEELFQKPQPETGYFPESLLEQFNFQDEKPSNQPIYGQDQFSILPIQKNNAKIFNLDYQSEDFMNKEQQMKLNEQFSEEQIFQFIPEEIPKKQQFPEVMKELKDEERKKNGNIPKFICRTTVNRYTKYKKMLKGESELWKQIHESMKVQKRKYEGNKNANNTLEDMNRMFSSCSGSANPKKRSLWMRKILHRILRSPDLREDVIYNHQIQLTKEYLISLKVQALRCIHKDLVCRLKAR